VPVAYGDRLTIRHQRHADDPKVAAELAGLYLRQASSGYVDTYVWAPPIYRDCLAAGRPDRWLVPVGSPRAPSPYPGSQGHRTV
jgi:hypothetical protein